jgi:hypothetical protein
VLTILNSVARGLEADFLFRERPRRQGQVVPFTLVEGPEAWTAAEYQDSSKYTYVLSETDVAELDAAVAGVAGRDIKARLTPAQSYVCVLCYIKGYRNA